MRAVTVDDQEIGRLIREARTKRGLTIKELAPVVVVSAQQMQKYELGENRVTAANLIKIAQALEIDVTELLGTGQSLTPQARTLAEAFDRLPESPLKTSIFNLMLSVAQSRADRPTHPASASDAADQAPPGHADADR